MGALFFDKFSGFSKLLVKKLEPKKEGEKE